jgi:(S)-ureidoglycine aminohydrolase
MRPIHQLVHARTRVEARYALMPLEGFPASRLPNWPTATAKVLASPRLGAEFVQYLIELPAGGQGQFAADSSIETFHYVLSGEGESLNSTAADRGLKPGSFGLTAPTQGLSVKATTAMRLLILRKKYEPTPMHQHGIGLHGHESKVEKTIWADDKGALLQTLIPDELQFDLAMNIFTFESGHGLPVVETHVMEHGALILEGKGLYYLGGEWMEVEAGDFIYMAPFCPQSFYATGTKPAKYIYYKNVNREVPL